jgi:hypothetical protein
VVFGALGITLSKCSSVIHFETSIVELSACSAISKRPSELSTPLLPSISHRDR